MSNIKKKNKKKKTDSLWEMLGNKVCFFFSFQEQQIYFIFSSVYLKVCVLRFFFPAQHLDAQKNELRLGDGGESSKKKKKKKMEGWVGFLFQLILDLHPHMIHTSIHIKKKKQND